ncbi:hypothetical protein ABFX02_06G008100 [Erythranthe guttata]
MGSCVSVHKHPDSAFRLRFSIGSKNDKILIPSPVKDNSDTVNVVDRTVPVVVNSHFSPARFPHADRFRAGSKDEAFFDSQPWLESDCEDDFVSVNGDFTPSRGSTPVHHSFSIGVLQVNKAPILVEETADSVTESSTPDKKKRLSELFKESLRVDNYADNENAAANKNETSGTPGVGGERTTPTPNGVLATEDKSLKSGQCCLPRLLSNRSFNERKKRMSPARSVG